MKNYKIHDLGHDYQAAQRKGSSALIYQANCIAVTFPYKESTKEIVKAIPGATFGGASRIWKVPHDKAAELVAALPEAPAGFVWHVEPEIAEMAGLK